MKRIRISNDLWDQISPFLPNYQKSIKGGRPRLNLKNVFEGIIYLKINKLPWKAAPQSFGSGTSLNDYYRGWASSGFFDRLKEESLLYSDELIKADFDWEHIKKLNKKESK